MIGLGRRSPSWRETSFAVLDFEATGLDVAHDHVVSYGLVPVERGRACIGRSLYRIVRPPVPPSPASIRVHGITPPELQRAPPLDDVVHELVAALDGRTLVAHAAWVELGFLEALGRRHSFRAPKRAIDVIALASRVGSAAGRGADGPVRLVELATAFGVPVLRTHHALSDAVTTAELFLVLATRLESAGESRLRDLVRAGGSQIARSSRRRSLERVRPVA